MLGIQVTINGDSYLLEVYENDPVNIKYQFADINEISKGVGSFTQSFRIPATEANVACFGTFFESNSVNQFNPKRKVEAVLTFDTIPLINGFIQLKGSYIQKEKYSDYEVVFFGEGVSLSRTLGEQKLSDLDLSAYDHTVNYDNVTDSWDGSLLSGDIRYGLIDRGAFWGGNTPMNAQVPLTPNRFTPFIRVRSLVEAIVNQNGFELDSDFFDDEDDLYTPLLNGRQTLQTEEQLGLHTIQVGLVSDDVQAVSGLTQYIPSGMSELTPFYDSGSNFNTATDAYTPPYDASFSVFGQIVFNWVASGSESAQVSIQIHNITTDTTVYYSGDRLIDDGDSYVFIFDGVVPMLASNEYALRISAWASDGDLTLSGDNTTGLGGSWWGVSSYGLSEGVFDLDTTGVVPDIKQIDYLNSLQKMFNLVFVPDRNNPAKIKVEPFNDYTASTEIKDWTDLIDYSKDVAIRPTTDIQYKKYEFTYSDSKDFLNKFYKDNANRTFGRYLIEDTENDFSTSELTIKPLLGAYPLQAIEGTNLLIFKNIDGTGAPISDPLAKVVYWGGKKPATGLFIKDGLSTITESDYPYFGHYDEVNPSVTDNDLNYGGETPSYPIEANPYNNLYNTYWRPFIDQLYSSEARTMEAHFNLSIADVADFKFNDKIWIKNSYWRILELSNSPNSNDLTKVKLLKILGGVRPCEWLPYQSNPNGQVTFIDSGGIIGAPTQSCCELFGYEFIDSACYYQNTDNNGLNRPSPNAFSGIVGSEVVNGITVGNNLEGQLRNLLQGRNLTSNFDDVAMFGSNGLALAEGIHRAGGWWHENFGIGNEINQHGQVTFIYEGDFDDNDEVELFVDGRKNNRLSIPNESGIAVTFNVSVITNNVVSGQVVKAENYVFNEVLLKINSVASTKNGGTAFNPDIAVGTFSASPPSVKMKIDTTTDTSQHRIVVVNHNVVNTDKTRIVCVANYTMGKF